MVSQEKRVLPEGGPLAGTDLWSAPLEAGELHRVLREARTFARLTPTTMAGFDAYLLTRYADVKAFLAAHEEFPGGAVYQLQVEPVLGRTFISMDGAEHDLYRQLAMPAFRSRAVARFLDADLEPLAHEVIDAFAARGRADLVAEFTGVLPFRAISRKIGVPAAAGQRELARAMLSFPVAPDLAIEAGRDVRRWIEPVIEAHRGAVGDDVLSHLLTTEFKGKRLTEEEVLSHVLLLYAVGATTTSDAMSSLFWVLLTEPGLLDRAREDPAARPRIVRELLRYEPAVAILPRMVANGGTVAGFDVPPGTFVLVALAAANRDPAMFDDPDRFDADRDASETLTFGFGSKHCPGSHLGQGQLVVALEALLERLPGLRLIDASKPAGAILRSVERLEVAWDPR
jgi:cytochrome P450